MFYEGHLPAFSIIAFLRRGLGRPPVDARLEKLFERGIDPDTDRAAVPRSGADTTWPSRDEVLRVRARVRRSRGRRAGVAELRDDRPAMHRAQALYTALEHEAMHQETLLYMWHRLPYEQKLKPGSDPMVRDGQLAICRSGSSAIRVRRIVDPSRLQCAFLPASRRLAPIATTSPFGWDNEFDEHRVECPRSTSTCTTSPTREFLEFVEAGGYRTRDVVGRRRLGVAAGRTASTHPAFWSRRVADRRRGAGAGCSRTSRCRRLAGLRQPGRSDRLRALEGAPAADRGGIPPRRVRDADGRERSYPWGEAAPGRVARQLRFRALRSRAGRIVSRRAPARGACTTSIGNGWEWTSTVFGPFPGFEPMASYPEYSADFFDGQHYVMKGASPATAKRAGPPQLPQLVPAELSVRLREVQDGDGSVRIRASATTIMPRIRVDRLTLEFAADVRRDLR